MKLTPEVMQQVKDMAVECCSKAYMKAVKVQFRSWQDVKREADNIMGPLADGRLKHIKNIISDKGARFPHLYEAMVQCYRSRYRDMPRYNLPGPAPTKPSQGEGEW